MPALVPVHTPLSRIHKILKNWLIKFVMVIICYFVYLSKEKIHLIANLIT